jgi:hypothetical protein
MVTQDNLNAKSQRPDWISQDTPWMDLVVERYTIKTSNKPNYYQAIMEAAWAAEKILYWDIGGALQLDLQDLWGKSTCKYPDSRIEHKDAIATWKATGWLIPPYLYEDGVDWVPYDGMQKFHVKTHADSLPLPKEGYAGIVEVNAFVWDDTSKTNFWRLGCLADIVNRNSKNLILAEGGRLQIPLDKNQTKDIKDATLDKYSTDWVVSGFEFPPNDIGDISYRKITLNPIDIAQRNEMCNFRDR